MKQNKKTILSIFEQSSKIQEMYRLNQALELSEAATNTACKNIVKNIDFSKYDKDDILSVNTVKSLLDSIF